MDTAPKGATVNIKLYGYAESIDSSRVVALDEVTLVGDPALLRRVAKFLLHAADEMERHDKAFGHEHLQDFDQDISPRPAFVVARPNDD